MAQVQSHKL